MSGQGALGCSCDRTDVNVMHCEARELAEAIAARLTRLEPERSLLSLAARLRSLLVRLAELDGSREVA